MISSDATSQIFKREIVTVARGKMSFHADKEGSYKICSYYHSGWGHNDNLLMSIKIGSENMDEPKLGKAIKHEDLDPVHKKAKHILDEGKRIVDYQESEIQSEDKNAQIQISTSRTYYLLTTVQVVVVIGLGLYQIFSFRKYLYSHNFI